MPRWTSSKDKSLSTDIGGYEAYVEHLECISRQSSSDLYSSGSARRVIWMRDAVWSQGQASRSEQADLIVWQDSTDLGCSDEGRDTQARGLWELCAVCVLLAGRQAGDVSIRG